MLVHLNDVLLLRLQVILESGLALLVGVGKPFLELIQGLLLHVGEDVVQDLWGEWGVLFEVLAVELVEALEGAVVGQCALVLSYLLPGGLYLWDAAVVDGAGEGFDHRCHSVAE